jgi:hypothetical protein
MKLSRMARRCALNSPGYMTLRTIVLALALLALALAIFGLTIDEDSWPAVVMLAGLCALLAYERRHYGAAQNAPMDDGWRETDEQFVDDNSGQLVRVWFNPSTGRRRYVAIDDDKTK